MQYNVGDIVQTKGLPKILGYVVDVIYIADRGKYIPQIFFEDSDEPEWCYKESYFIVKNKRDIEYIKSIYLNWRNENV